MDELLRPADVAKRLGVSIARFADLAQLKNRPPVGCLINAFWKQTHDPTTVSLFPGLAGE